VEIAQRFPRRGNGHVQVELTREALAQLAGTTVYNVNRHLSDWELSGLVRRTRCTIIVRDLPGLKRLCA